jgi:hypothetical protein
MQIDTRVSICGKSGNAETWMGQFVPRKMRFKRGLGAASIVETTEAWAGELAQETELQIPRTSSRALEMRRKTKNARDFARDDGGRVFSDCRAYVHEEGAASSGKAPA